MLALVLEIGSDNNECYLVGSDKELLVLVSDEDRKLYVSIRFVLVKDQVLFQGDVIGSIILFTKVM